MGPRRRAAKKDPPPNPRRGAAPVISRTPLPLVEVQGSTHIVSFANPAFCSLLGKTPQELLGKPFAEIVPGGAECVPVLDDAYHTGEASMPTWQDDSEASPALWLQAAWPAPGPNERRVEVIVQLTKTTTFWRNATAMNEALLIAGLHQHELTESAEKLNDQLQREITERKTAEAALREAIGDLKTAQGAADRASKAKDGFLAALSHELRTPLTPVLLAASTLRDDQRRPADAREQLGVMERNITLEARLIDDLLDLTKITHGKLQLRTQLCDAHQLIGFAVEIVRQDARAKELSIESDLAAKCHWLLVDPARFQQVIWNLLRNAVKFTPPGGRISIRTRAAQAAGPGTWLHLEVSDTGSGIEQSQLEQIFLPFDQGGLASDHRFGGVGLGLAVARAVVDAHGGRISVSSGGLNHGATFIVELPGASESLSGESGLPGRPSTVSARDDTSTSPPRRLLLVEDHQDTLQILALLLERNGHHVVTATTFAEALAAAAANRFDLLISDLGLPDGTGIELMRELRDTYGLRGIALSGYGTEEDIVRSRDAGFVAHLLKPVANADLLREIASLSRC